MTDANPASRATSSRLLPFAIGVAGAVLGLLPWAVAGTLPLQNLWATEVMPEAMPFVLLPLSQYSATMLFSLVLLGGVFAGLAVRVTRRRRAMVLWPAALGVAVVHVIAAAQSFLVLAEGLGILRGSAGAREVLYFGGLLGGTIAAALLAQLGLWMTARPSVAVASLAIALAAVPFATWVARWFGAFAGPMGPPPVISMVGHWLPGVVVGGALVWCGVRPAGRLVVWVVALLSVWVVPALFTAIGYGLGMRVLQGNPVEMAEAAAQVFPLALAEVWWPAVLAAAIAVVGTVVRAGWATRATPADTSGADAAAPS
ncbi:hypothetical protein OED01_15095 [Microbacterium sp. M28]|uniref:hypothetical protein n=1 Tax=Microbacterium sp. M28 TaxID=2962064 RepID=UPI0021F470D5|nr:hypothetical protein [Microbacterium sp. M28]UYO96908.1 hypothetical protein OED01_15095 [Microbacterium sp. M28]